MSSMLGYARVSSIDQDLTIRRAALQAAGCTTFRAETVSGTSRNGRSELETLMQIPPPWRHADRHPHRPPSEALEICRTSCMSCGRRPST